MDKAYGEDIFMMIQLMFDMGWYTNKYRWIRQDRDDWMDWDIEDELEKACERVMKKTFPKVDYKILKKVIDENSLTREESIEILGEIVGASKEEMEVARGVYRSKLEREYRMEEARKLKKEEEFKLKIRSPS